MAAVQATVASRRAEFVALRIGEQHRIEEPERQQGERVRPRGPRYPVNPAQDPKVAAMALPPLNFRKGENTVIPRECVIADCNFSTAKTLRRGNLGVE